MNTLMAQCLPLLGKYVDVRRATTDTEFAQTGDREVGGSGVLAAVEQYGPDEVTLIFDYGMGFTITSAWKVAAYDSESVAAQFISPDAHMRQLQEVCDGLNATVRHNVEFTHSGSAISLGLDSARRLLAYVQAARKREGV